MNGNLTDLCKQEKPFDQDCQSGDRQTIYFSSGETLGESEEEDNEDAFQKEPFSADTANLSWKEYSWFLGKQIGKKSLQTCEYLGGKLARLFGLDAAKYQYAIDEFNREEKKRKNTEEDSLDAFVEGDAENISLALKKHRKYGAANEFEVPCTKSFNSSFNVEHSADGTHNKGYQDDD